jgi:hypothetical protein
VNSYKFFRGSHIDAYAMKFVVHADSEDEANNQVIDLWVKGCRRDRVPAIPIPTFTLYSTERGVK